MLVVPGMVRGNGWRLERWMQSNGIRQEIKYMTLEERAETGAQLKRQMNCCQAVLAAFADKLGKSEDELMRMGSGFGSGMGTMEGTCGALVGAIMVSSLLGEKGAAMAASRAIMPRFKELCGGATVCRDLKGIGTGKVLCSCEDCVRNAIRSLCSADTRYRPSTGLRPRSSPQ